MKTLPEKPKVSVCVTTYNHEEYIAEALDSVLMQETDFDYEIILGEDESQDGTREICSEYARQHPDRIRLFLRSRRDVLYIDGRPTGRFNSVQNLKAARGEYIALLDGDDYWTDPHKLQKQVDFLERHPACVVCHHDARIIDERGRTIKNSKLPANLKRDFSADELIKGAWVLTVTACFRNVVRDYPPEFFKVLNGDRFLFSLLGNFGRSKYLGHVVMPDGYRVHGGGIWSSLSDEWQRTVHSLTTSYWLRAYYERLGRKEYAQNFAQLLHHAWILYQLPSAEQVESTLTEHLQRMEDAQATLQESECVVPPMLACLSANLCIGAAFALFGWQCWERGRRYLQRAMELDAAAWCDGASLEKVLVDQGFLLAESRGSLGVTRLHNYVHGIRHYLPPGCEWPREGVRRVEARLYAELAYRCHLAADHRRVRYFTWRALRANPSLLKDRGMLRRALGL